MRKLSVCASISYFYTAEVEDDLCELDKEGYLKHEASLYSKCCDADPVQISGINNVTMDICSICDNDTDELLYNS